MKDQSKPITEAGVWAAILGLGRTCGWPDPEAPQDWDDTPICGRPATKLLTFNGAQRGVPSCDDCAERMGREAGDAATVTNI
jgi:hypothetical protein